MTYCGRFLNNLFASDLQSTAGKCTVCKRKRRLRCMQKVAKGTTSRTKPTLRQECSHSVLFDRIWPATAPCQVAENMYVCSTADSAVLPSSPGSCHTVDTTPMKPSQVSQLGRHWFSAGGLRLCEQSPRSDLGSPAATSYAALHIQPIPWRPIFFLLTTSYWWPCVVTKVTD